MTAQLDLFTEDTPTPAADLVPGRAYPGDDLRGFRHLPWVRLELAEALRAAVPMWMVQMRDWEPQRRRRHGLPAGWTAQIGMADALMFGSKIPGRGEVAFTVEARGLAVLAYESGGVTFLGVHWCADDHPGCPNSGSARPQDILSRCRAAIVSPEWQGPLDEYERLLDAEDAAEAAARQRAVGETEAAA